jgi:hypothetical protein
MIIQVTSHRGRERFFSCLGRRPVGLYAIYPKYYGDCYEVTDGEVELLKKIRLLNRRISIGWRFSRVKREDLNECISFS